MVGNGATSMGKRERALHLDLLRVVASIGVMLLHIACDPWQGSLISEDLPSWRLLTIPMTSGRWAVPVFVMISGALFLASDKPINAILRKNALRLVTAFLIWSAAYALYGMSRGDTAEAFARHLASGWFHMWFVKMMIGLYLLVPLLRPIARCRETARYLIVLAAIFAVALPTAFSVMTLLLPGESEWIGIASGTIGEMGICGIGYAGYFVLGYHLETSKGKVPLGLSVALLLAGSVAMACGTIMLSQHAGEPVQTIILPVTPLAYIEAVGIWGIASHLREPLSRMGDKWKHVLVRLSSLSFGAYLAHVLVIYVIRDYVGVNAMTYGPVTAFLLLPVVAILSYAVSWAVSSVPALGRYAA